MGQTSALCQRNQAPCEACVHQYGALEENDHLHLKKSRVDGVWFDDSLLARACASSSSSSAVAAPRNYVLESRRKLFSPHSHYHFRDFYLLGNKLGDGASADVFEAVARPINRNSGLPMFPDDDNVVPSSHARRFAVKIFTPVKNHPSHKPYKETPKNLRDFFRNEWEMLAQLEHPHIVRMYESFQEENSLYIVMEMCYGGELIEYVRDVSRKRARGGLEEKDARHMFRQMLYAAIYLNQCNIVHRDIKLENFLLVGAVDSARADVIKLCDFGTAVQLSHEMPRALGRIGTLSYTAPEICLDRGATTQADAWSLGVVLYILFVGAKPFRAKSEESRDETMQRIIAGDYNQSRPTWIEASTEAKNLVKSLIVVDETRRSTTVRSLQHKWCVHDAPSIDTMHHSGDMNFAALHVVNLIAHVTSLDPLQQFVMSLCSKLLDESNLVHTQQWAAWYDFFFALDANKDGQLDFTELAQGLWSMCGQISSTQLSATLQALDLNSSGAIEWTEWAAIALLSIGGLPLQDELLATANRLLAPRDDESVQVLPPVEKALSGESASSTIAFSQYGRQQISPVRIQQLRERFAAWVPAPASNVTAIRDLCLADLREILDSTSWFGLDSSCELLPSDRPIAAPWAAPAQAKTESLVDSNWLLASSPRDHWSRECPTGPQQTKSAFHLLPIDHASSAPNSPSGSQRGSPDHSPRLQDETIQQLDCPVAK